ncbi:HutD/Ves family protein [Marinicella litoralis]|nr:HutD family protein [Marinicella litoralis]
MFKIITPDQYKTIPWKNGSGNTTELAISPGGTLQNFDWRLSIASVNKDGVFSDFSGYDRQLILLRGNGIKLTHNQRHFDDLRSPLSIAAFDGSYQTLGELHKRPIEGFNVMTNQQTCSAQIKTYSQRQNLDIHCGDLVFVYAAYQSLKVQINQHSLCLPAGHLLQIEACAVQVNVVGAGFLVIDLKPFD